jgi:hypothetical protein
VSAALDGVTGDARRWLAEHWDDAATLPGAPEAAAFRAAEAATPLTNRNVISFGVAQAFLEILDIADADPPVFDTSLARYVVTTKAASDGDDWTYESYRKSMVQAVRCFVVNRRDGLLDDVIDLDLLGDDEFDPLLDEDGDR